MALLRSLIVAFRSSTMYRLMHERLPGVIVVPIGHRHTMLDFHKRRIELRPWVDGVSELMDMKTMVLAAE